jgi:hypothetical protein
MMMEANAESSLQRDDDPDRLSLENELVDDFDELDDELDSQPEQERELEERLKMFQGRRGTTAAQALFSRVLT